MPAPVRTTIWANPLLMERIQDHVKTRDGDNQSQFINRALLNQLEKEGDFEIRDLIEQDSRGTDKWE